MTIIQKDQWKLFKIFGVNQVSFYGHNRNKNLNKLNELREKLPLAITVRWASLFNDSIEVGEKFNFRVVGLFCISDSLSFRNKPCCSIGIELKFSLMGSLLQPWPPPLPAAFQKPKRSRVCQVTSSGSFFMTSEDWGKKMTKRAERVTK